MEWIAFTTLRTTDPWTIVLYLHLLLQSLFNMIVVCSDVGKWTSKQWRDLGPAIKGLTPADLRRMSRNALKEIVDEIKDIEFSKDQAEAILDAAKEAYQESG